MNKWFNIIREGDGAIVSITNEIGGRSVAQTAQDFEDALGDAATIDMLLDSPGGDAGIATAVYKLLRTRKVTATVTGQCSSAAVIIFLSASHRLIGPDTQLMIHDPSLAVFGGSELLRKQADCLEKLKSEIAVIIQQTTGQPMDKIRGWMSGEKDVYFPAKVAVGLGFAHEIVLPPARPARVSIAAQAAVVSAPNLAVTSPSEELFRSWLRAFGDIRVGDRAKFLNDLGQWTAVHVQEISQ
jgi:ATP-dependent protease ClpP protease subunit